MAQHTGKTYETSSRNTVALVLTGLAYLLFHLRLGADSAAIFSGTLAQMLLTAPYAIGFTYLLLYAYRRLSRETVRPHWARILRIFFTMGILFAFFFALYEHGGGDPYGADATSAAGFWQDVLQMLR